MFKRKSVVLFPALVLLFLSLVTTASTVGTRADAQSGNKTQELTVYIHALKSKDGHTIMTADQIEWYQGAEANRIFAEREPEAAAELGGVPDDYYIVNDSDSLTSYPIADNATVTMQIYDHTGKPGDLDIQWNEAITLHKFMTEFAKKDIIDLSQSPYHITVQDGKVISIVQQYIP